MTPLIRLGIAWIGGIALARWLNVPWEIVALLTILAAGTLLIYRHHPRTRWWVILTLIFIAGMARFIFAQPRINGNHVAFYNDSPIPTKITGVVADEPDIRDYYINLRVRANSVEVGDSTYPVDGLVLVRAPRYPE